jgi:hypothetical protein
MHMFFNDKPHVDEKEDEEDDKREGEMGEFFFVLLFYVSMLLFCGLS